MCNRAENFVDNEKIIFFIVLFTYESAYVYYDSSN